MVDGLARGPVEIDIFGPALGKFPSAFFGKKLASF